MLRKENGELKFPVFSFTGKVDCYNKFHAVWKYSLLPLLVLDYKFNYSDYKSTKDKMPLR